MTMWLQQTFAIVELIMIKYSIQHLHNAHHSYAACSVQCAAMQINLHIKWPRLALTLLTSNGHDIYIHIHMNIIDEIGISDKCVWAIHHCWAGNFYVHQKDAGINKMASQPASQFAWSSQTNDICVCELVPSLLKYLRTYKTTASFSIEL